MTSIRRQLTVSLLVGLGAALLLAGAVLRWGLARSLEEQFDFGLEARLGSVATLLELHSLGGEDGPEIEYDFQPDGLTFDPPAVLTIVADVSNLNDNQRSNLNIYVYDPILDEYVPFEPPACTD